MNETLGGGALTLAAAYLVGVALGEFSRKPTCFKSLRALEQEILRRFALQSGGGRS